MGEQEVPRVPLPIPQPLGDAELHQDLASASLDQPWMNSSPAGMFLFLHRGARQLLPTLQPLRMWNSRGSACMQRVLGSAG